MPQVRRDIGIGSYPMARTQLTAARGPWASRPLPGLATRSRPGEDPRSTSMGKRPVIGFVSTYPPTECGIATFTAALRMAMAGGRALGDDLRVVSLVQKPLPLPAPEVVYQHMVGDPGSLASAVEFLNKMDAVVIQHEYGIYGGPDGDEILDLVASLRVPVLVVLHTVPKFPTPRQRTILETLIEESDEAVVLSQSAQRQLTSRYDVGEKSVMMVPHGARSHPVERPRGVSQPPRLLTWGLIGPGKGLETAIEALARLGGMNPKPRYLILGETHPKVRAASGDVYLEGLIHRSRMLGLQGLVEFDNQYADLETLGRIIDRADIVIIPYDSTEQVTSGVLVEAIAAGKPVIATAFPHAVEMLASGAGVIVPGSDPAALAAAIRELIVDPARTARMAKVARALAAKLDWVTVAAQYETILARLVAETSTLIALDDLMKTPRQVETLSLPA